MGFGVLRGGFGKALTKWVSDEWRNSATQAYLVSPEGLDKSTDVLLSDAGRAAQAVVAAIFPGNPVSYALAVVSVVLQFREKRILAKELVLAELDRCRREFEQCPEHENALWYAQYTVGTTLTEERPFSPEAAQILARYLADGGDQRRVLAYLSELEKRRRPSKFALATGTL